jgi:hypothetical protein
MQFLFPLIILLLSRQTLTQSLPPPHLTSVDSITTLPGDLSTLSTGARDGPEALSASGGSGCKANSVAHAFNDNRTILTLIFSEFIADLGPGIPLSQNRRFCSVSLKMRVPAGWTFQVNSMDWRGYVDLDRGVRGTLGSTYFWAGKREEKVNVHKVVEGPMHDSYLQHKEGEKDKSVWLPCSDVEKALHINTAVRLATKPGNDNAKGSITVDSIDAKFKQVLNLGWKKC